MISIRSLFLMLPVVLSLLLSCSSAPEQSFIEDRAGLLTSKQKERLSKFQQLLLKERDVHLFISTLDQPATDLDQTTLELFEKKSLGRQTKGARGLLLVIDPHLQQARIEVGYDLEGIFPDGFIVGLEYDQMLPFFQQDRIGHGIEALSELLVEKLMEEKTPAPRLPQTTNHLSGGAGARIRITDTSPSITVNSLTDNKPFPPQPSPLATLESYRDSLSARNKRPDLGIYTPESRDFFASWLVTDAQQQSALKILENNLPSAEIIEQDNLAVIRFPVTNRQAAPYYLRNSPTGWQLDFVTMSRTIAFNHRNQWHFKIQEHPYRFAFRDWKIDTNGFPHKVTKQ